MPHFIHLHLHTEYSLVDSLNRIKPLVKAVPTVVCCLLMSYSAVPNADDISNRSNLDILTTLSEAGLVRAVATLN